jgi:hypothetical protein
VFHEQRCYLKGFFSFSLRKYSSNINFEDKRHVQHIPVMGQNTIIKVSFKLCFLKKGKYIVIQEKLRYRIAWKYNLIDRVFIVYLSLWLEGVLNIPSLIAKQSYFISIETKAEQTVAASEVFGKWLGFLSSTVKKELEGIWGHPTLTAMFDGSICLIY